MFIKRYFDRLFILALGILTFTTAGITRNPLFFLPINIFLIYYFLKSIINKKDLLTSILVLCCMLSSCFMICHQAITGTDMRFFNQ